MKDIILLYKNPGKLVEKYQNTIEIIINKFIQSGFIKYTDKDDFKQDINEQLLIKIPKIQKQYNQKCYLHTYLSAIIRNIILEKIRKNKSFNEANNSAVHSDQIIYNNAINNLTITDEIERFRTVLILFNKQKEKLELCLKFIFRLPITEQDIFQYFENLKKADLKINFHKLNDEENLTDSDIYSILTGIINAKENKSNTPDAIRKWIKSKLNEIIGLMNGNPKRANYDKSSLELLIEKYFNKKERKISIQEM